MVASIFALVLVAFGLFCLALQRFYSCVPVKELKRLAARGDHLAEALYRPVAYGESMRLLLWLLFGVSTTLGFVLFANSLVGVPAFIMIGLSLAAVIAIQSLRLTVRSARLAVTAAPALTWLLNYVHRPFAILAQLVNSRRDQDAHSGLYEKEDFVALLRQQQDQLDNRIAKRDLALLERVVQFDDHRAADLAQPMSRLHLVNVDEHLGPILLADLHKSKQDSFLVYQGTADNVVGTLFLRDALAAKEGGKVGDVMRAQLCFVHEDFSLRQVLNAFVRTGQFMLVVVNPFEEALGVISLSHFMVQLIGSHDDADDFTAYDNRTSVAAFKPKPVAVKPEVPEVTEPVEAAETEEASEGSQAESSSPEATEMVE
ncbi:MAG TPA: CBS domain-containing protein [Patescibacteria group bacterium]|nr:CBS domain-containing protein [Patescibacteria group bacterium]